MTDTTVYLTTQAAELAANARAATLDGREYAVVPVVALVAGVVNGYLVTPDELRSFADAWNGRPVPVRHPKDGGGYVSANNPQIIQAQVVGQFFNARVVGGSKLVGELWLDVAKCQRLGSDALTVLQRLRKGEPVEVSTAYFCDVEQVAGVHDGKPYMAIQRNLRPDHIALLPDEVGACSWKDGCGAPRVNQAIVNCDCQKESNDMAEVQDVLTTSATATNTAEETMQAPAPVANDNDGEGTAPAQDVPNKESADAPAPAPVAEAGTSNDLAELAELVKAMGGASKVAEALRSITANAANQKAALVQTLAANAQCAFSGEDLQGMSLEQLEKLDRSLRPAHYGVRPASNAAKVPEGGFTLNGAVYRPYMAPGTEQKQ